LNKIYIYDNSAIVPGGAALDRVGDYIREEKAFTYILQVRNNGGWDLCVSFNVGQLIIVRRADTTGVTVSDWTGIENSTAVRTLSATIDSGKVRAMVGGAIAIRIDAHAND